MEDSIIDLKKYFSNLGLIEAFPDPINLIFLSNLNLQAEKVDNQLKICSLVI